jgi:hypothetical protein
MNVKVEASQSQIGTNDLLLRDIEQKNLGIRLVLTQKDHSTRIETVLTEKEAMDLVNDILKSLDEINLTYRNYSVLREGLND